MTQLYLAKWPNGSISLVEAANELELFRELDSQCDPYSASICKINKSERKSISVINEIVVSF